MAWCAEKQGAVSIPAPFLWPTHFLLSCLVTAVLYTSFATCSGFWTSLRTMLFSSLHQGLLDYMSVIQAIHMRWLRGYSSRLCGPKGSKTPSQQIIWAW
jgi:hypothetical protein